MDVEFTFRPMPVTAIRIQRSTHKVNVACFWRECSSVDRRSVTLPPRHVRMVMIRLRTDLIFTLPITTHKHSVNISLRTNDASRSSTV